MPAGVSLYTAPILPPASAAGTVIGGSLAQSVVGVNAYAWWNSEVYSEVGFYWTPGRGFLRAMGVAANQRAGGLAATAPLFHASYDKEFFDQNYHKRSFALPPHPYLLDRHH